MKIVISPAKSLDYDSKLPTSRGTQPQFLDKAEILNNAMEKKSRKAIKSLMNVSDALADLNYQRYKDFSTPFDKTNARPAVYAFAGDVYQGLEAYTIPTDKLDVLQEKLRILSGMYGILRPLDLIQPYRLEMGTDLKVRRKKNLYEFWGDQITNYLNDELEDDELFVNLASNEYFKAINTKKLKVPVISPVFKDMNNGKLKVLSFFAKKARGAMVRYIIENDIDTAEGIRGFDYDGYGFSEEHTVKANQPVFIR